jgi:Kdo2-lipid IVA lauroyltransferase/acyltransferase
MKRPTLAHRFESFLTRAAEAGLSGVSANAAGRVGAGLGALVRSSLGIRRDVVQANLRLAFPDADDDWIEETTRAAYRHLGREAAAMLRLSTLDRNAVTSLVEVPDHAWEAFQGALAEGRGVVLATGHYGNWEMAAAAIAARGVPIEAIVKRQSNPLVDARIQQARRALGVETVDMREAARRVPRALLSGKAVGIVADQDARRSGVWVPFFGVARQHPPRPGRLRAPCRSPLFAAVARRMPDGTLPSQWPADRYDPHRLVRRRCHSGHRGLAAHLEREIRVDPTQYFWFHKRWKTRPPEEPSPPRPVLTPRRPDWRAESDRA